MRSFFFSGVRLNTFLTMQRYNTGIAAEAQDNRFAIAAAR